MAGTPALIKVTSTKKEFNETVYMTIEASEEMRVQIIAHCPPKEMKKVKRVTKDAINQ